MVMNVRRYTSEELINKFKDDIESYTKRLLACESERMNAITTSEKRRLTKEINYIHKAIALLRYGSDRVSEVL